MESNMIWAYFLQLSDHMWGDTYGNRKYWYLPPHRFAPENRVDVSVWDKLVSFIAERNYNMLVIDIGDGLQYDSHPEISAPDAWSKDLLRQKLAALRALGIEPIPKLNLSSRHSAWMKLYNRMISSPVYYQVCADLIGEVCEVFDDPRLFHLGLDEESTELPMAEAVMSVRAESVFWHDAYFLFSECEKHGARPWVWADHCWHHPESYGEKMPKSVLQSNWYYLSYQDIPAGKDWRYYAIKATEELDKLGFDQIPTTSTCSFGFAAENPYQTLRYGKERVSPERLKGFMTVPWAPTLGENEFYLKNDAHTLFEARKRVFPETL